MSGAPPDAEVDPAGALGETRARTLELVSHLDDGTLERVHSLLLSPLVWDLGHIAAFEDLWISRTFDRPMLRVDLREVYDADETPRASRGDLPFLRRAQALDYMAAVRQRTLGLIERADPPVNQDRLELVIRHEQQHNETMLQGFQLAHLPSPFTNAQRPAPKSTRRGSSEAFITVLGGEIPIGSDPTSGFAYDNEKPQHLVHVDPFQIARAPVSNAQWSEFIFDGGYEQRELWSDDGWRWRTQENATKPLAWTDDGRQWRLGECLALDPDEPVVHVSWFEADAFARAAGARLPTEFEWELAARWDPVSGNRSRHPWGSEPACEQRANIDQRRGGPVPIGSHPDGDSVCGLTGLIGDTWEWTSSHFSGYPGFVAHPYREYSEQFFGAHYRVLRGGSWATRARVVSAAFRNWDLPERRQIFSGLRLARDAT